MFEANKYLHKRKVAIKYPPNIEYDSGKHYIRLIHTILQFIKMKIFNKII